MKGEFASDPGTLLTLDVGAAGNAAVKSNGLFEAPERNVRIISGCSSGDRGLIDRIAGAVSVDRNRRG